MGPRNAPAVNRLAERRAKVTIRADIGQVLRVVVLICATALGGCAAGDDAYDQPTGSQLVQISNAVGAVDWSKAEDRSVTLTEFHFSPANLVFKRNQPYELTMKNDGAVAHRFVAPEFFDAVAVKGLIFADGEVSMPLLKAIAFAPGETKTLVFVPLKAGEYPLTCDQPLHATFGMEGTIRID
jgi:uncharacterized cupredoxin-like copper-binding protein